MKRMFIFAVIAVAFLINSTDVQAAKYTWSQHDITFTVPDNGYVTYNMPQRFEIEWTDMNISIQIFSKDGADDETLKRNLRKTAAGYNIYDGELKKINFDKFKGFYLVGEMPDGSMADFCNVVSSKSNLCLHIEINYLRGREKQAMEIIKSFTVGQKQKIKNSTVKQKIQKKGAKPKAIKPTPAVGDLYDA